MSIVTSVMGVCDKGSRACFYRPILALYQWTDDSQDMVCVPFVRLQNIVNDKGSLWSFDSDSKTVSFILQTSSNSD